jgi:predicted nucleic acid-binding protein
VYLFDTNIISELRKGRRANSKVLHFYHQLAMQEAPVFLSVITLGELRRGVDLIRYRGDEDQAKKLEEWLACVIDEYADRILSFGIEEAQLWGRLRAPHYENAIDKQIAATALINDLTLVTLNTKDFTSMGLRLLNPFA